MCLDALIYGTENTSSGKKSAIISLQKFMLSLYRAKGDENYLQGPLTQISAFQTRKL